jgi:hypothetical protein
MSHTSNSTPLTIVDDGDPKPNPRQPRRGGLETGIYTGWQLRSSHPTPEQQPKAAGNWRSHRWTEARPRVTLSGGGEKSRD